jgi:hypothetical protein
LILGILVAVVWLAKPAAAQNGAWCIYKNGDGDGSPQCGYATLQQCLADRLGSNTCSPSPYSSAPESPPPSRLRRR